MFDRADDGRTLKLMVVIDEYTRQCLAICQMTARATGKVIISNGFSKFHLAVAASEAQQRGKLAAFFTGAYPTPAVRRLAAGAGLGGGRKVARLLARREDIPDSLAHPIPWPETYLMAGSLVRRVPALAGVGAWLNETSLRRYARRAAGLIERFGPGASLYHYRAGFGHESVRAAKRLGMVTLCDHSIAHPAVLDYLVTHDGQLPPPGTQGAMSRFWRDVLADIEQADAVVVNSQFVKDTFLHQGWNESLVHIVYSGVDGQFIDAIPETFPRTMEGPARLLFAGVLERRKGADTLMSALAMIDDQSWRIELLGAIAPDIADANRPFLADPRVAIGGTVSRAALATRMASAEVFIFPSLAEGSARVVFEALACGCYVITTPNTGSIVEDGVHGALVPPGDADALAGAIRHAIADRDMVAKIGQRNAALVRDRYRQSWYGDGLARLYAMLIQN